MKGKRGEAKDTMSVRSVCERMAKRYVQSRDLANTKSAPGLANKGEARGEPTSDVQPDPSGRLGKQDCANIRY